MDLNTNEILLLYVLLSDYVKDCDEDLDDPSISAIEHNAIAEDRRIANKLLRKFQKWAKDKGLDIAAILRQAEQ